MKLILRKRQEKQIDRGYPWVFSNQIDRTEGDPMRGDIVSLITADGRPVGQGFYHDASQIAFRLLTRNIETLIDDAFFERRFQRAIDLRSSYYAGATHYRLAFSESDGLPGTIIDRYGDVLTWTSICFGMEKRREALLDTLETLVKPKAIVERNDVWLREKDMLERQKGILRGQYDGPVTIEEQGVKFEVDVLNGPKTGFFMDQRHHREAVARFAKGKSVLDVCCADGGFGLTAAAAGASSVHFIDSAGHALERARANAKRNDVPSVLFFDEADALVRLGELVEQGKKYDIVILDPPAFAKSKRHLETATRAYQRLNISAFQLLSENGILATSSCSQAVKEPEFLKILRYSARKTNSSIRMLYRGFQPPDHPVLDTMPETQYLKFYVVQKG